MATRWRPLTAAVLLASYLLASAGAWLHSFHAYLPASDSARLTTVVGSADCHGADRGGIRQTLAKVDESRHPAERIGAEAAVPSHDHDDCIVCRFQLTQKLAEFLPFVSPLSGECPEPIVLGTPLWRVAPLLATPESRAPPALA